MRAAPSPRNAVAAAAFLVALAAVIWAVDRAVWSSREHPVQALSPADGAVLPRGRPFTVRARSPEGGQLFLMISNSPRLDAGGHFPGNFDYQAMTAGADHRYSALVSPVDLDSPHSYINTPGRYYWMAYREVCDPPGPCRTDGAVRSFVIR
jgi:hypothetical protein